MKIAFLIKSLGGGGAEKVCVMLANQMAKMGLSIEILTISENSEFSKGGLSRDVTIRCAYSRKTVFSFAFIYKRLTQGDYDSVLCFGYELAVVAILLRKVFSIPCAIVFRNVNAISKEIYASNTFYRRMLVQPLIRRYIADVDLVINQCIGMEEDFISFTNCPRERCITINNPVSVKSSMTKESYTKSSESANRYFLYAGRLEKQKRLGDMLRAFKEFTAQESSVYKLKIYGGGSEEFELRRLAEDLNIAANVDFMGYSNELSQIYRHAVATLLTSEYEGFPNVLLESIAMGTPVISYDCPTGPNEIIRSGVNGLLVPNGDVKAFAKAMTRLIRSPFDSKDVLASAVRYDARNISAQYAVALSNLARKAAAS